MEREDSSITTGARVVGSHVVHKVETDEESKRKLNARICPDGNEDSDKDEIRKDSSHAQLSIVRLVLSPTTFLGFSISTEDIKGAYLQSGPIKRERYARPLRAWCHTAIEGAYSGSSLNFLKRLLKLAVSRCLLSRLGCLQGPIWSEFQA